MCNHQEEVFWTNRLILDIAQFLLRFQVTSLALHIMPFLKSKKFACAPHVFLNRIQSWKCLEFPLDDKGQEVKWKLPSPAAFWLFVCTKLTWLGPWGGTVWPAAYIGDKEMIIECTKAVNSSRWTESYHLLLLPSASCVLYIYFTGTGRGYILACSLHIGRPKEIVQWQ